MMRTTQTHKDERTADSAKDERTAESLRHARFATLPERIRPEDTVETTPATPHDPARDAYDSHEWLVRYCL
ncbi:hypothetical protein [Streptomyces brasiliensis]|nr:hypothetical protein [Streptomyces brasiliensis]